VRKLIGTLALLAACSSSPKPAMTPAAVSGGEQTGARDAGAAVRAYLAAAKTQDLQAMSAVWGTPTGAARETIPRDELDKRELINMRCLAHDSYAIISDAPGTGGRRVFAVALKRRDLTRTTNFYAVPGPSGRWYLESFDPDPIQDLCTRRS